MPKYRFPIAINDCYETYKWVIANAEDLGIDKHKIIVTGDSAGANASAAVAMMLNDNATISFSLHFCCNENY